MKKKECGRGKRNRQVPLSGLVRLLLQTSAFGAALIPYIASGQVAPAEKLPGIEVIGNAPPLVKVTEDAAALPANVTVINRFDLDKKTIATYGDIFRGVTGVYVNEYGQGLVAYELKMRGFTSGHGRDVATFLDGVPLNITGSQHINGFSDQAQLIPELVDRVEIVRGPFSIYAGNHAVAGSVQMFTDNTIASSVKLTVDSFGRVRLLPIFSTTVGPGHFLLAVDGTTGPAYTHQSDVNRLNILARYAITLPNGVASVRLQGYHAVAEAPGFIDVARIESGEIDRRDALAKGIGDNKDQQNVVLNYRSDDAEGLTAAGGIYASAYAVRDRRERFVTFDVTLPVNSNVPIGAERDRLHQDGFELRKTTSFSIGSMPAQVSYGLQYNRERVSALHFTADGDQNQIQPSAALPDTTDIDRTVLTTTRALYAQLQIQPTPILKITGGVRYDHLTFDVNLHPQDDTYDSAITSGVGAKIKTSDHRVSPKLGAALQVYKGDASTVDLYANYALGLKSPYAFSDFFSNVTSTSTVPDLALSTLRSVETGLQGLSANRTFSWRAGVWDTRQEKEGQRNDAGLFQAFGTTVRRGVDLEGGVLVTRSTRLYGNYSFVRARSVTAPAGQDYLPNVPKWIGTLGVESVFTSYPHRVDLSLEDSIVGPQPITVDNVERGRTYNRLTARGSYTNAQYKGVVATLTFIAYDRQYEETRFDFGGGVVAVSPRPRFKAILGIQAPFSL